MDEPAEVQPRALERVTGAGSRNLAGAAQGLPPGWIAEVAEVIGGAGPTLWRVWRTPARWVSLAGADMRGGAAVVVSGPDAGAGHPGGCWGLLRAGYRLRPAQPLRAKSVAQGGRCPGVRPKHLSEPPDSPGEPVIRRFHAELGPGVIFGLKTAHRGPERAGSFSREGVGLRGPGLQGRPGPGAAGPVAARRAGQCLRGPSRGAGVLGLGNPDAHLSTTSSGTSSVVSPDRPGRAHG